MRSSNRSPLTYCIMNKKDTTVKPVTIEWPLIYCTRQRKKLYLTYYKRNTRSCEVKKILTVITSLISPAFLLFMCPPYPPHNRWRKKGTHTPTTPTCTRYLAHIKLCGKELVTSIATVNTVNSTTNLSAPWESLTGSS